MPESFRAYIDESGDIGFNFKGGGRGSTPWFVLSAVVVSKKNDTRLIGSIDEARRILRKTNGEVLHFRELRHEQRIPVIRAVAGAPVRTVSVAIEKASIKSREVFQGQGDRLYNYACRFLLERISSLCYQSRNKTYPGDGFCELIFSNRAATSYDEMSAYIAKLKTRSQAGRKHKINWTRIDPARVRAVNHDQLAGLLMADAVATGLFYAINRNSYGEIEPRYYELLKPTIYRDIKTKKVSDHGLAFWPTTLEQLMESDDCYHFFEP
ncbi:MAG TPA: DUF3800 domain-containing protein [Nitrospira sp.]|nr:DUF3800 domain-containing protein [Nitrospira sp.]